MGELTQKVLIALQAGGYTESDDYIRIAGDLLEKVRLGGAYSSGFADVNTEQVSASEYEALKESLADAIQAEPNLRQANGLVWALSKSHDPQYKDIYRRHLERSARALLVGNHGIFQALLALDGIDENILERGEARSSSQSLTEVEKNLRQARAYLSQYEVRLPW